MSTSRLKMTGGDGDHAHVGNPSIQEIGDGNRVIRAGEQDQLTPVAHELLKSSDLCHG
jgi:hypothetical protein